MVVDASAFNSYDPDELEDIPLLFQTGYLTIKKMELTYETPQYMLEVPNVEVRESLMRHLLNAYTDYPMYKMSQLGREMILLGLAFSGKEISCRIESLKQ
ncbi:hypothetical protein AGMMS50239_08310 [Bacteroidia bacterium]|nr:hypothetical protein AGMMS50239_08310 [Bacteroidia bacterium]